MSTTFRRWCASILLVSAYPVAAVASHPDGSGRIVRVDIAAGTLDAALLELGEQTGLSVVLPKAALAAITTRAVRGELPLDAVLDRLIAGRCLTVRYITVDLVPVRARCAPGTDAEATPTNAPAASGSGPPPPPAPVEEILVRERYVTGSRIRNPAYSDATPVDLIERTEIELSGQQSLSGLLRYLPAVSGNSTSTLVTNGGDGSATVTLRGLPASNTLVLVNGRRINPDAFHGAAVDLNTLPLDLVERVEVLKDGASAIYGSDAVAGVVNVVTRRDMHGVGFNAYCGGSDAGDLNTLHASVVGGFQADRVKLTAGASLYDQDPLYSRDRAVSETSDDRARGGIDNRSSATVPARLTLPDGPVILEPGEPGTRPDQFRPATLEDRYEYRTHTSLVVPSRRWSAVGSLTSAVSDDLSAYFEGMWSHTSSATTLAPAPVFTDFEVVPLVIEAGNVFNPFGVDIHDARRRMVELGPRVQHNRSTSFRSIVGLEGFWRRLHWDLSLYHHESDARERYDNQLDGEATRQALLAGCRAPCVPLNLFGPAGSVGEDALAFVRRDTVSTGGSRSRGASLQVDFPLVSLPAGTVEVASGVELRTERLRTRPDPIFATTGTIGGANLAPTSGARTIREAYVEFWIPVVNDVPLAHRVDLQMAGRLSDYDDFGSARTPKLAVRYEPTERWAFRGSVARGFRAPTLSQLHRGASVSFEVLNDPCTAPANVDRLPGCTQVADPTLVQFLSIEGGNPNLEPETTRSYTYGVLYNRGGFDLSVDHFDIRQHDVVDSSAQYILDENATTGRFADRVVRNQDGNVTSVTARLLNLGRRRVKGYDVTMGYTTPASGWGRFRLTLNATHIATFEEWFDPNAGSVDHAGTFMDEASEGNGALPEWKASFTARWKRRYWQAQYDMYYVSPVTETIPISETRRDIGAWLLQNAQLRYLGPGTGWFNVAVGVNNVFDERPPFAASAFNDSYDSRTYDISGRYWYVQLGRSI